jgi:hypothetical protein
MGTGMGMSELEELVPRQVCVSMRTMPNATFIELVHNINLLGYYTPLPVSDAPWTHISLDFITDLPTVTNLDSIIVVKDCFSKMAHFIPCSKTIDACQMADLFFKEIFCLHGLPTSIVSDCGLQFVSHFCCHLFTHLGVSVELSLLHHPKMDGSTKVINQILKQYLHTYCSYLHSDWLSLLPLAKFAYNNSTNAQSNSTPFFACTGMHPVLILSFTCSCHSGLYPQDSPTFF